MNLVGRLARLGGALAVVAVLAAAAPMPAHASSQLPAVDKEAPLEWGCLWDCGYIKNVKVVGYPKYNVAGVYVQASGPSHPSISKSIATSNGYTATVGIDAKIINASISGNVTQTYTIQYSNTLDVPAGQCWGTQGYIIFKDYTFEVWTKQLIGDDTKLGTGRAWYYYGMGFTTNHYCV